MIKSAKKLIRTADNRLFLFTSESKLATIWVDDGMIVDDAINVSFYDKDFAGWISSKDEAKI